MRRRSTFASVGDASSLRSIAVSHYPRLEDLRGERIGVCSTRPGRRESLSSKVPPRLLSLRLQEPRFRSQEFALASLPTFPKSPTCAAPSLDFEETHPVAVVGDAAAIGVFEHLLDVELTSLPKVLDGRPRKIVVLEVGRACIVAVDQMDQ